MDDLERSLEWQTACGLPSLSQGIAADITTSAPPSP